MIDHRLLSSARSAIDDQLFATSLKNSILLVEEGPLTKVLQVAKKRLKSEARNFLFFVGLGPRHGKVVFLYFGVCSLRFGI